MTPNMASQELRTWEVPAVHGLQKKVVPFLKYGGRSHVDLSRCVCVCVSRFFFCPLHFETLHQRHILAVSSFRSQFCCVPRIESVSSAEKRPEGQALPGTEQISDLTLCDFLSLQILWVDEFAKWKLLHRPKNRCKCPDAVNGILEKYEQTLPNRFEVHHLLQVQFALWTLQRNYPPDPSQKSLLNAIAHHDNIVIFSGSKDIHRSGGDFLKSPSKPPFTVRSVCDDFFQFADMHPPPLVPLIWPSKEAKAQVIPSRFKRFVTKTLSYVCSFSEREESCTVLHVIIHQSHWLLASLTTTNQNDIAIGRDDDIGWHQKQWADELGFVQIDVFHGKHALRHPPSIK